MVLAFLNVCMSRDSHMHWLVWFFFSAPGSVIMWDSCPVLELYGHSIYVLDKLMVSACQIGETSVELAVDSGHGGTCRMLQAYLPVANPHVKLCEGRVLQENVPDAQRAICIFHTHSFPGSCLVAVWEQHSVFSLPPLGTAGWPHTVILKSLWSLCYHFQGLEQPILHFKTSRFWHVPKLSNPQCQWEEIHCPTPFPCPCLPFFISPLMNNSQSIIFIYVTFCTMTSLQSHTV